MVLSWKYKNKIFSYITEERISEVVDVLHNPKAEKYLWFAPITIEGFSTFSLPIIEAQKESLREEVYPASAVFTVSENGELFGTCGISMIPDGHNVAMIGYQLKPSVWGQGNGTCCAEFLLHYARTYLKIRKLFADCVTENTASVKILEKCGFSFEGVIKEKYELRGELHDNSWYGLKMASVSALPEGVVQEVR